MSDICNLLGSDWVPLSQCLEIPESDAAIIQSEYHDSVTQQAMVMLKLWMTQAGNKVSGDLARCNFTIREKLRLLRWQCFLKRGGVCGV